MAQVIEFVSLRLCRCAYFPKKKNNCRR